MENLRHTKIEKIIEQQQIGTQEELMVALQREGFAVTQATVSRDIKKLMLMKVPAVGGGYRYVLPPEKKLVLHQARMNIFQEFVLSIYYSGPLVVFKVLPATAQAVAVAIDGLDWPEILGSVAGNDTVFVVVRDPKVAERIVTQFCNLYDPNLPKKNSYE